jgi:ribonuclease T2
MVTAADVADAFVKANPELSRDDVAVMCDKKRLSEVRICLTRSFAFRACPEVTQRACKLERMTMPAVRGG